MTKTVSKPKPKPKFKPVAKLKPKPKAVAVKVAVPPAKPVGLLVSVRSVEEAKDALAAGADLIDVKDPAKGALGMAEAEIVPDDKAAHAQ